jgi:hypothetical protein
MRTEGRGSTLKMANMLTTSRGARPLTLAFLALMASVAATSTAARADQIVQTPEAPVVVIQSASGLVTVAPGDPGAVRVTGAGGVTATKFLVSRDNQGRVALPSGAGLPARRFTVPGVREGSLGVRIENPGGDITVYVPRRVSAVFVKAATGDVAMSGFRGPYVVVADGGNIDLRSLFGFGHARTTTGHVNMTSIGGNVHAETTFGSVTGVAMFPERADVKTQGGDIRWTFGRLRAGPYRFASGAGNVHVGLGGGAAANIDAQSKLGTVVNRFGHLGVVRFRSPHATSVSVGGGGPEIMAASQSGLVEIGPHRPPRSR